MLNSTDSPVLSFGKQLIGLDESKLATAGGEAVGPRRAAASPACALLARGGTARASAGRERDRDGT